MSGPSLREWEIEVALGTLRTTVFAAYYDQACEAADVELRALLDAALDDATWFVRDAGPVDMDDAVTPQEGRTHGIEP